MANSVEFNNNYYTINNIVQEWLSDNDLSNHWYAKSLSWAMKGLRELSLHHWQEPITVILTVDNLRTATVPENYVNWSKIGLKIGQYIKMLAINGEMHQALRTPESSVVESLPIYNMPNGVDLNQYGGYYFFNYNGNKLFGIGGALPSKGHVQIVKRGDTTYELSFDYDIAEGSQIVFEYISDGFNPNGESIVNAICHDYIYKTLEFKYEEKFNPNRNEASIRRKGMDLADSARLVRASRNDLDPKTLITLSRREARMTPKL